jgi:ubiquinone/menaquinone biosynthesis C-methylase UbiE
VKYDPKEYWEHRFSKNLDLTTVGHSGLGYVYNYWLYKARFRAMNRALRKLNLNVSGRSLLDIGVGSGAWIPFWQKCNISKIVGMDITSTSVRTLQSKYTQFEFIQENICTELTFKKAENFDIVTAFDVLFHITNDIDFNKAIENISTLIKKNGWILICDSFCNTSWGPFYHEHHRSFDDYAKILNMTGLDIIHIEPIFITMTTTICHSNFCYKVLLDRLTKATLGLVGKLSIRKKTEWLNHLIGCSLYLFDVTLCRIISTGPSLKILFAQKS